MKRYDPARDHDPLFSATLVGRTTRPAPPAAGPSPRSVSWGGCPGHASGGKLTGIVVQGKHLVWRYHTKRTVAGTVIECDASGQPVCELPARASAQHRGPYCTCSSREAVTS